MTKHPTARPGTGLIPALMVFLLAIPLALWAPPAAEGQSGEARNSERDGDAPVRALRPGDVIQVTSWREPDLSGEYLVDEDGRAVLPLLGTRTVSGVPPSELRQQILDEYRAQFRQDSFQVILMRRVRILGAVAEPGLYHVDQSMTLGDAIALAGGVAPDGNPKRIRIMREGETVHEVELSPDAPILEDIRSGDQIMVLQRSWISRHSTIFVGAMASGLVFYFTRR